MPPVIKSWARILAETRGSGNPFRLRGSTDNTAKWPITVLALAGQSLIIVRANRTFNPLRASTRSRDGSDRHGASCGVRGHKDQLSSRLTGCLLGVETRKKQKSSIFAGRDFRKSVFLWVEENSGHAKVMTFAAIKIGFRKTRKKAKRSKKPPSSNLHLMEDGC